MESIGSSNAPPSRSIASAAKLSIAAYIVFLLILAALHVIKSEVDPTWETTSIYARGKNGWIMQVNFAIQAFSYAALFVAIKSDVKKLYGRIGLGLLVLAAVGALVGGIFVSDPMQTPQDELSTSGTWHGIGAGLALWFLPIAALLINLSLRKNPAWASARKLLLYTAGLPLLGVVIFMVAVAPSGGDYGPGVNIGWPERLVTLFYGAWLVAVAWHAIRLRDSATSQL